MLCDISSFFMIVGHYMMIYSLSKCKYVDTAFYVDTVTLLKLSLLIMTFFIIVGFYLLKTWT